MSPTPKPASRKRLPVIVPLGMVLAPATSAPSHRQGQGGFDTGGRVLPLPDHAGGYRLQRDLDRLQARLEGFRELSRSPETALARVVTKRLTHVPERRRDHG